MDTLLATKIAPQMARLKIIFPFPKVGYVSFLEGTLNSHIQEEISPFSGFPIHQISLESIFWWNDRVHPVMDSSWKARE